MVAVLGVL